MLLYIQDNIACKLLCFIRENMILLPNDSLNDGLKLFEFTTQVG